MGIIMIISVTRVEIAEVGSIVRELGKNNGTVVGDVCLDQREEYGHHCPLCEQSALPCYQD